MSCDAAFLFVLPAMVKVDRVAVPRHPSQMFPWYLKVRNVGSPRIALPCE